MDGYVSGIVAGFNYRNSKNGTNYDYNSYMSKLLERKIESRKRQVEQSENYYNEELKSRHPRPSDPRQRAIYDAIMSNSL